MAPEEKEGEEQRLRAVLRQLQAEAGVLERVVYKNKNQHRRAAYFQYLLKVRRDLKLLQSANLLEILNAVLPVIGGRRPAHTMLIPVSQNKMKPGGNHNYHKRLLGVARLLSQMAEPVMKAAIQISLLLAKSFFIQFSTMVLALLARIRVLVQQILLDVVSVFNTVSDLTDKKQSVKLTLDGVQAFREYYPSSGGVRTILECAWEKDNFVLLEGMQHSCQKGQDMDQKSLAPEASIQYETVGLFNEGQCLENPLVSEKKNIVGESYTPAKQSDAVLADQSEKISHCSTAGDSESEKHLANKNIPNADCDTIRRSVLELRPDHRKRVAFVSVGNPKSMPSETNSAVLNKKPRLDLISHSPAEPEDPLGNLLGFDSSDRSIF